MRKIIVHYHLFKNGGTSIDKILSHSFGDAWMSYDITDQPAAKISSQELHALLLEKPGIKAFSSHQIAAPIPTTEKIELFPIIFLRHPLDRIMSCYLFEWGKQKGLRKPDKSLEEYINFRFQNKRRNAIEEFQTYKFANIDQQNPRLVNRMNDEELLDNAKSFIASLPFFGIVENFEESLKKMETYIGANFSELKIKNIRSNSLQDTRLSVEEKIEKFENSISKDLFSEVLERNKLDFELYAFSESLFKAN